MNFVKSTKLKDVVILEPQVFSDNRGYFLETFNQKQFEENGITQTFVQDNHSFSAQKGVLRGLHFQKGEWSQAKLVYVISGSILDVIVDLRPDSPSFGQWESFELNQENHHLLYVPRGFAHGFCTLTPDVGFIYKCDNLYNKASEGGVIWNDPGLNIPWPLESEPILADKDKLHPTFDDIKDTLIW